MVFSSDCLGSHPIHWKSIIFRPACLGSHTLQIYDILQIAWVLILCKSIVFSPDRLLGFSYFKNLWYSHQIAWVPIPYFENPSYSDQLAWVLILCQIYDILIRLLGFSFPSLNWHHFLGPLRLWCWAVWSPPINRYISGIPCVSK